LPRVAFGGTYYSWQALEPIRWLQIGTLINPLVYLAEGFRAALTPVPHMHLVAVYGVLVAFTAVFTYVGIKGFTKRVIA
jgi:ABC-2 type transport system permease protein